MDTFVARDKIEHGGKWYIVSTINRESSSPYAQGSTYAETMARFLSSNSRMCYAKVGDLIFMSNGTDRLRTNLDGEIVPWGLPTPSAPTLSWPLTKACAL